MEYMDNMTDVLKFFLAIVILVLFVKWYIFDGHENEYFVSTSTDYIKPSVDTLNPNVTFLDLVHKLNGTVFHEKYDMSNLVPCFSNILSSIGKYSIMSANNTQQFTLFNVTIQNDVTFELYRLQRVDFFTNSIDPFTIDHIRVIPDQSFVVSQNVLPTDDTGTDSYFRIMNPLHLFNPYKTSLNEMVQTDSDYQVLQEMIIQKEKELLNL